MHFTERPAIFVRFVTEKPPFLTQCVTERPPHLRCLVALVRHFQMWVPPRDLDPHRGSAPGPRQWPLSGPLDPMPLDVGYFTERPAIFVCFVTGKPPFLTQCVTERPPHLRCLVALVRHFHMWVPPRDPGPPIDMEYNKRLDCQRPCLEDDFNGGCNDIVQSNKSVWRRW